MLPTLDLLLPTYRWNSYVRGYVGYLASIVEDDSIEVRLHIGDNSTNSAKHEFLSKLKSPNVTIYPHSRNIGLYPNLIYLLQHSSSDLVMTLGDDDWIHSECFAHAKFLATDERCTACAGYLAAVPPNRSSVVTCFEDRFMGSDPAARGLDYVRYALWEHDVNWLALGTFRRETMSLYVEYSNRHPFQFHFRDQMLSQIALLTGLVKGLRRGFTLYQTRSADEMASHLANHSSSMTQFGLPSWLHHYYHYWLACEYATLYLWRGIPDTVFANRERDADRIFMEVFARFLETYRANTQTFENHFEEAGIWRPMYDVLDHPCAVVGLRSFHAIISATNADAGRKFAQFLQEELIVDVSVNA